MMDQLFSLFKKEAPAPVPVKLGDVAWSESQLYVGAFPKYNPDDLMGRKGTDIYRKMMLDEQVKAVVKFKRDAITSRDYILEIPPDALADSEAERRVKIYETMLEEMTGSFNDGLNFVMSAMYQGFSITEQVYEIFDYEGKPYVGIKKLKKKPFDSFSFQVDEYGSIKKLIQEVDGKVQTLDLAKFVYFIHNPEFDEHYGQSELREAYRSWYSKDVVIRLYNQFLERFAGGFTTVKPAEGHSLIKGSPEYNAILAAMQNIRTQSSILFPANMDMEVHQPSSTDQFEKAIIMHDLQIAKALLVPNLLGVTHQGDTGSYSQASTQLEAFLWTLDADANRLEDALNEQIFIPLAKINFADGIGPRIKFKPVSETKKFELIAVWKDLVASNAVEVTDTDEAYLRDLLDFPEKGEPIKEPVVPVAAMPNGKQPPANKKEDQTVMGAPSGVLVSDAAFSRASQRVSFSVIDHKTADMENEQTAILEGMLANMVAGVVEEITDKKLGTPAGDANGIQALDFSKKDMTKARRAIDNMLKKAWDFGVKHSNDEVSKAKKLMFKADMSRLEIDAAEFLKANGFRMLGNLTTDMRRIVQGILINGIKFSWTTKNIVQKIYDSLTKAGFISMESNAVATGRILSDVIEALEKTFDKPHRVNTAVRTNVFEALNEARYSTFTDPELDGFVVALEYSAILDSRTTDICIHLDRRIYPADAPEWNSYRPPNHYNCRSLLVPVTIVDTELVGKDNETGSRYSKPPRIEPQQGFGGSTG